MQKVWLPLRLPLSVIYWLGEHLDIYKKQLGFEKVITQNFANYISKIMGELQILK